MKEKQLNEKKLNVSAQEFEQFKKLIPQELRNEIAEKGNDYMTNFILKTEERLDAIIKEAKSLNYQLHAEPIAKLYATKGLMEVKLINNTAEKDVVFWPDEKIIGKELYDIIDDNESDYKTYLTQRIKEKRRKAESLTKKETILTQQTDKQKNPADLLSENEKTISFQGSAF